LSEVKVESRLAAGAVRAYLDHWQEHVAALQREVNGIQHFFFTGRGPSLSTVFTSYLTTKEASHVQGEGLSSATLRHGPMEMIGPGCYVMVFAGDPLTSDLNLNLAKQLQAAGAIVGWVDTCANPGVYHLPPAPESLRPIMEILPVQMLTLALAELQGRVAGQFERSTKVTVIE
jgi:glucosamine--fructose-6-phosphate aminotransferase (isomerizing)